MRRAIPLLLLLAIAACDGGADVVSDRPAGTLVREAPVRDELPPPSPVEPRSVVLRAAEGATLGGEATVEGDTEVTRVAFAVVGALPNTVLQIRVHGGSCAAVRGIVDDVAIATSDAAGAVAGSATLARPASYVLDGRHSLVVQSSHLPPDVIGACGEIPDGIVRR